MSAYKCEDDSVYLLGKRGDSPMGGDYLQCRAFDGMFDIYDPQEQNVDEWWFSERYMTEAVIIKFKRAHKTILRKVCEPKNNYAPETFPSNDYRRTCQKRYCREDVVRRLEKKAWTNLIDSARVDFCCSTLSTPAENLEIFVSCSTFGPPGPNSRQTITSISKKPLLTSLC